MSTEQTLPVILLVDDDENDRMFFGHAVRKAGYRWRVIAVGNGREALECLSGTGPFADRAFHPAPTHVLLDLKLPEVSGLEVLQWIRSQATLRHLPVAILSSSRQPSDLKQAKAFGVDAYEAKPVELSALVSTVRSLADCWHLSRTFTP
jgi:CheY-like chemotaxis protein